MSQIDFITSGEDASIVKSQAIKIAPTADHENFSENPSNQKLKPTTRSSILKVKPDNLQLLNDKKREDEPVSGRSKVKFQLPRKDSSSGEMAIEENNSDEESSAVDIKLPPPKQIKASAGRTPKDPKYQMGSFNSKNDAS